MAVVPTLPAVPLGETDGFAEWEDEYEEEKDPYITSDGKPMAETDQHCDLMLYFRTGLRTHFAGRKVYVSGNNFVHYRKGDYKAHVSPDCYVVFGVEPYLRDNYKVWEEGDHFPDVIIEFTSKETRRQDFGKKKALYEQTFQTYEYFTFDPTGKRRKMRLRGFRLQEGKYEELTPEADGRLYSEKLGLALVPEGKWLRLYDPLTPEFLRTPQEEFDERVMAERRAEEEGRRAEALADENERLRAELERLRRGGE